VSTSQALLNLLTPWNIPGLKLERWGSKADGGYVVPEELIRHTSLLITGGIGDNVDFEAEVADKLPSVRILLFDHTIHNLPANSPARAIWHPLELGPGTRQTSLTKTLELAGAGSNESLLLKLDIESAEWDLIESAPKDFWKAVSILILEIHNLQDRKQWQKYRKVLEQLDSQLLLIHAHGNNCSPTTHFRHQGVYVPTTMELTYINRANIPADLKLTRWNKPGPTRLDSANDPFNKDLPIDYFIPRKYVFWKRLKKNLRRMMTQLPRATS
jgi:hypothetical protein